MTAKLFGGAALRSSVEIPAIQGLANHENALSWSILQEWDDYVDAEADAWVVSVRDDLTAIADELASLGTAKAVEFAALPNTFVIELSEQASATDVSQYLTSLGNVDFFYPLTARQQSTRATPNDPLYPNQWHLNNTGQSGGTAGEDVNVKSVWDTILGTDVVIGIVDDGLQHSHPDLTSNYSAALSFDFNNNDSDPSPSSSDRHGTSVAGVAAGDGFNGIGVSGSAPDATLAGLRLISAPSTDQDEADALSYMNQDIDIYSNSWGPSAGSSHQMIV